MFRSDGGLSNSSKLSLVSPFSNRPLTSEYDVFCLEIHREVEGSDDNDEFCADKSCDEGKERREKLKHLLFRLFPCAGRSSMWRHDSLVIGFN